MDSDGVGDRHKDIQMIGSFSVENTKESMEEKVPKILSPEIYDVFHVFANMLDMKSFMNLAFTCKDMYKRCMENNQIRINVNIDKIYGLNEHDSEDRLSLAEVHQTAKNLPCAVNVHILEIMASAERPGVSILSDVQSSMKEIGVSRVNILNLGHHVTEWERVFAIIEDYHVNTLNVYNQTIEKDILRSILQLNLEKFSYDGPLPADFILEIDSPIRELSFQGIRNIFKRDLMDIIWKIQSESFSRLSVPSAAVNWNAFDMIPFDHHGPLPEDRPLLITRNPTLRVNQRWILNSHGSLTKCVVRFSPTLEIFKCEPWDYPYILRDEEQILKDLAEKRARVYCSTDQFRTFFSSLAMVDSSHEGPLPDVRPLYCKASENHFWMLDENEKLMKCSWEDGCATWKTYNILPPIHEKFMHPALAKHMFWNALKKMGVDDGFYRLCFGQQEFASWFDESEKLEFEYSGPLPNERPLVFQACPKRKDSDLRVVLLEGHLFECEYSWNIVRVHVCHYSYRPSCLFTADNVLEMLKDPKENNMNIKLDFEMFRDGLELFKKSIFVRQKPVLITETKETEIWYVLGELVRRVVWKEGRLLVSNNDLRESPPDFMTQAFNCFAEQENSKASFTLDLEEFRSCLEQFVVVPFDYSGPLKMDFPLAFVKDEIRHTCRKGATRRPRCDCAVLSISVWFLWDGVGVTKCSWGKAEANNKVIFGPCTDDVPTVLQTKEFLMTLLQINYDQWYELEWFGRSEDFNVHTNDFTKFHFVYNGPLPQERPLLFDNDEYYDYFLLREDGAIIRCAFHESSISFSLCSHTDEVPPALESLL